MGLNSDCVEKIMGIGQGEAVNQGFLDIFNAIVEEINLKDLPSGTMIVPMYGKDSNPQPGDHMAELHFVIRRIAEDNDDDRSGNEADTEAEAQSEG
jgi:hypothetical protein